MFLWEGKRRLANEQEALVMLSQLGARVYRGPQREPEVIDNSHAQSEVWPMSARLFEHLQTENLIQKIDRPYHSYEITAAGRARIEKGTR